MRHLILYVVTAALLLLFSFSKGWAQSAPTLTIISPANGTTVQPGQVITIVVATTNPADIGNVIIASDSSLGDSAIQPASPIVSFPLTAPTNISPGWHSITAEGGSPGSGVIRSNSISLFVPVTFTVLGLRVSNKTLMLKYPGQQIPLDVNEVTENGITSFDSSFLSFNSSNAGIAAVDATGTVTAETAGQTTVTVSYQNLTVPVNVTVLGSSKGDLNGDGKVDIDDVHVLQKWLNTPANGPNDARDLNHDGKIDALDARILTTLCTYPHCATHP